jgi:hypothetical protein
MSTVLSLRHKRKDIMALLLIGKADESILAESAVASKQEW